MAQHSQSNNKRRTQDIYRQIVDAEWRTSVTTIRTDIYFFSNQFSKLKSSSPRRFLAQHSVARLGDKTRDHLQRKVLAQHKRAREIRWKQTCYPGRFFARQRKAKGFLKGVSRKIDDTYATRKNLNEIRDLVLNVSEAYAKTCRAKIVLKIVGASMLHGITGIILKSNIVALKLVVVNRPVSPW